jgi:hypothetical protein
MKSAFKIAIGFWLLASVCLAQVAPSSPVTFTGPTSQINGTIATSTGATLADSTLTFTLSQPALVSGTATMAAATTNCYTSLNGNVVGVADPLVAPVLTTNTASGTLPAGTYFVKITYVSLSGQSLPSPQGVAILSTQGTINVNSPLIHPSSATGYNVYIGTSTGSETLQGSVTDWKQYQKSIPLITGAAQPGINSSACNLYFSGELIPNGTYYKVDLIDRSGSEIAGYPQTWCTYGGAGGTINVSQGAPTGNCNTNGVFYPTPIFANPRANTELSVNRPLSLGSYPLTAGAVNGVINAAAYPGVDIGDKVNAAYAAASLPGSAGMRIRIPPGRYTFTTPIVLNAAGNTGVILEGDASGTALHYAGPSHTTAIITNYAGAVGAGVRDLTLDYTGVGSDVTGLALKTSSVWGIFENLDISGFANGVSFPVQLAYIDTWLNCRIHDNTVGINDAAGVENQHFYGGSVDNNQTGVIIGAGAIGSDLYFDKVSFDDNHGVAVTLTGGGSNFECDACHFENAQGGTASYIIATQGVVKLIGGEILDDVGTGTLAAFITSSATAVYVSGTSLFSAGRTVTQAVLLSGGNAYLSFSKYTNIPFYNTAYSGFVSAVDFSAGRVGMTGNATSGFYQSVKNARGCTTPATAGASCPTAVTVTWPVPFGDTDYTVSCTGTGITNLPGPVYYSDKASATIKFNYQAETNAAASYSNVDCIAVHD